MKIYVYLLSLILLTTIPCTAAQAAIAIPLTVTLSENVTVTGTPRIPVDIGGTTRYALYTSGSGSNTLIFTLSPQAGDVDLDGITIAASIDLNGGTINDIAGNAAALAFTPPDTSGIKINYPSLGMDFIYDADGRYTLNGTAYNDLASFIAATGGSFTRASIGTYYDSTGTLQTASSGTPRFDWDPLTHAAKGILIEDSRTNIIKASENFSGTGWTVDGAVLGSGGTSPNGSSNATSIALGTGNNRLYVFDNSGVTGNKVFSLYLKSGAGSVIKISPVGGQTPSALISVDLSTNTLTSSNPNTQLINIGAGWVRVSIPVSVVVASGNSTYWTISNSGPSVLIWGAQLEQGTFPSSYIPTTSAAVTRAADSLIIPTSGWFALGVGTLDLEAEIFGNTAGSFGIGVGSSGSTYLALPYVSTTGTPSSFFYRSAGAGPTLNGSPVLNFNTLFKIAGSYSAANDSASYVKNGTLSATGNGISALSSATNLYLASSPLNPAAITPGHYTKVRYFPARVSDAQLQLLTQ